MRRVSWKKTFLYIIIILIVIFKLCYHYLQPDISIKVDQKFPFSSRYVVDSSKCKIPNLNPFDSSVLPLVKKVDRTECAPYPPLTEVVYNEFTGKHTLKVDYSFRPLYTNHTEIRCCVRRLTENVRNVFAQCQVFYDEIIMDNRSQFLLVFCVDEDGKQIYQNMHAAVVKVNKVSRRKEGKQEGNKKMNVLLIGFDSVSRLNFYRTMIKTSTYLQTHGWVEMKGYNKIADNTLPNMMAFLTGVPPNTLEKAHNIFFDYMPFIWKKFSSEGYVTAYAEDQPLISTFHCHLRGFVHSPTDHYFRDYIYVGELLFTGNGRPPGCIAYKSSTEHLFDYLLDFVTVYKREPFFGLFWLNQISHNNLNRASAEDDRVLEMLERLRTSGTMNTTMVVLMSDHGMRVGDIRKSKHGWYEDRLPLLFISIPEWYKTQNDLHYMNLLKNSERLTSPYDLHMTLKHVLYGKLKRPSSVAGCESCRSLFTGVPQSRSCLEAGITPHWCTCHPFFDVPYSKLTDIVADHVVQAINNKLALDPNIDSYFVCEKLKVRNVLYLRQKQNTDVVELIVGVVTDPGGAEFEGTVVVHDHYIAVEDSISRLNEYGAESSCAENPISKLFCYCKEVQNEPL